MLTYTYDKSVGVFNLAVLKSGVKSVMKAQSAVKWGHF